MDTRTVGPGALLGLVAGLLMLPFGQRRLPAWLVPEIPISTSLLVDLAGLVLGLVVIVLAGALSAALNPSHPRRSATIAGALAGIPGLILCGLPGAALLGSAEVLSLEQAPASLPGVLARQVAGLVGGVAVTGAVGPLLAGALGWVGGRAVAPAPRSSSPVLRLPSAQAALGLIPLIAIGAITTRSLADLGLEVSAVQPGLGLLVIAPVVVHAVFVAAGLAHLVAEGLSAWRAGRRPMGAALLGVGVAEGIGWVGATAWYVGAEPPVVVAPLGAVAGIGVGVWLAGRRRVRLLRGHRPFRELPARAMLFGLLASFTLMFSVSAGFGAAKLGIVSLDFLAGAGPRPDYAAQVRELIDLHRWWFAAMLAALPLWYLILVAPVTLVRAFLAWRQRVSG
jgi:hypothetical protein